LKIFLLINSLSFGGAERQVFNDSIMLAESGYEPTIIYKDTGKLKKLIKKEKINLVQLKGATFAVNMFALYRILKKEKPDYVFAHMFWAQKLSSLPSWLTNTRLIFFEHGLGLWKKWYHILITRIISFSAEKIITVSEAKKNIKINREGFSKNRILVIPNFIYPVDSSSLKYEGNNGRSTIKIGFTGRFNKVKQLHLLVDIATMLRNEKKEFCFILLGDGDTRNELEEKIRKNHLEKNFDFMGYVNNPQEYMANFDAFVLPSKREDLSVALLEASSASLPCIAFDVGGNKEIIQNNKTGFIIEPFNIKDFASKLIWLMENQSKAQNMGLMAKKYVENEFSKDKRLERLKKIIIK